MAAAVRTLSPVIIFTSMPAPCVAAMASATSSRAGSIIPTSPRKVRSSRMSGWSPPVSTLSALASATASTRKASSAKAATCDWMRSARASSSSTGPSSVSTRVDFSRTTPGAPLT
jgi:hypothetical protein